MVDQIRHSETEGHEPANPPEVVSSTGEAASPCTLDYAKVSHARTRGTWKRIVAIILIGVLLFVFVSLLVPNLNSDRGRARKSLCAAAIGSNGPLAQSLKMYRFRHGAYPESLKQLFEKPDDVKEAAKWAGPYLEDPEGLKDPWDSAYQYQSPGTHNAHKYDLWSVGEDSKDGTEDDIKNW